MTQFSFDKSTKFFRSFTATTMPIVPVSEVGADEVAELTSFYAADFDDAGRLVRCRKFLNVEDEEASGLNLVFEDQYTYSSEGNLEARTLIHGDGKEVRWVFDATNESGSWRDVSLAHDQLTELESGVMCDVLATDLSDNAFTVSSVGRYLKSAEQVLRTATQDPRSDVLLLIPGSKNDWRALYPPDVFDNSLADIAMVLKPVMLENELPLVYPNAKSLSERDRTFADHEIRALAAHPVRVNVDETTAIGVIAMLACRDWLTTISEQVMSLLKRIAVFVELLIELGQRPSPIPRASDASTPLPD